MITNIDASLFFYTRRDVQKNEKYIKSQVTTLEIIFRDISCAVLYIKTTFFT